MSVLRENDLVSLSDGGGDNLVQQKPAYKTRLPQIRSRSNVTPRRIVTTPTTSGSSVNIITRTPTMSQKLTTCRRAISLEDLTPEKKKYRDREVTRHGKRCPAQVSRNEMFQEEKELLSKPKLEKLSAQRICQVLTLNAWRNERKYAHNLKLETEQTTDQVDDFHKQTAVLMRMLNTEKKRMSQAGLELQTKMEQMEESNANLNLVSNEKLDLEKKLVGLEIELTKMETRFESNVDNYKDQEDHYNNLQHDLEQMKISLEQHSEENMNLCQTIADKEQALFEMDEVTQFLENKMALLNSQASVSLESLEAANVKQMKDHKVMSMKRKQRDDKSDAVTKATREWGTLLSRIKMLKAQLVKRDAWKYKLEETIIDKERELAGLRTHVEKQDIQLLETSWRKQVRNVAKSAVPLVNYILTQRVG